MHCSIKIPLFTVVVFFLNFSAASAQSAGAATASATIVTPIMLAKSVDLNFVNIPLTPKRTSQRKNSRSSIITYTIPSKAGSEKAASLNMTSEASLVYSVSLPSSPVNISNGDKNVTVEKFTYTASTVVPGYQTFNVGATLKAIPGNEAANLSPAAFNVTINYN
jgi:hypothetical protein